MAHLYLVDSSIYIFRAYFSLPENLTDADGNPANAVRGYADFLYQLSREVKSKYFAFAFDESLTTSFRNDFFPDYKANRELPPEQLSAQLSACQTLTDILGFKTYVHSRFEADDLIGTIARKMRSSNFKMLYITADKDLAQLVKPGDWWWNFARREKRDRKLIKQHLGVWPNQIVDLLGLMGDSVDNIPGVPGIGQKTAVKLLQEFRSLENLYQKLHRIPLTTIRGAKRVQVLLEQHRDLALVSQKLARINEYAPVRCTERSLSRKRTRKNQLMDFCDQYRFGDRQRARLLSI